MTQMIDYLRFALYGILIAVLFVMFQAWQKEHPVPVAEKPATTTTVTENYIPTLANQTTTAAVTATAPVTTTPVVKTGPMVHITTDVMMVDIDTLGGNIVQVKLLNYPEALHSSEPFLLLNNSADTRYIAQSGLISDKGPETKQGQAMYSAEKTDYTLSPDQDSLQVNLHWQDKNGVQVTKTFNFKRNNYEIGLSYFINNTSNQNWNGNVYLQLMRKNTPPPSKNGLISLATYFGAAVSTPDKPFEKISFKQMGQQNFSQQVNGGWAAMIQHYFVSAWVPDKNWNSQYFTRVTSDGLYTVGMLGPQLSVAPKQTVQTQAKFYAGPTIADNLEKIAPGLQLTIDYGWFWFLSVPILWLMKKIYFVVQNWGWSIVLVTVIIKLMFYHLSAKSYRSMSAMKRLQPKIEALKARFGEDKQKFTQATLELYRKEKVNPMSGCLPILIQIPVFIALYWVLIESVELRQAPFILWIHDLSTKDPYYVLPILMGISMFLQQRLNPPPPDPMQAKVMMMMPVVFTIMFLNFPAGLMLYWFVNNTLSFAQQWHVMRGIQK
jgi:YidC/Oxa1 family membrane protein insertase